MYFRFHFCLPFTKQPCRQPEPRTSIVEYRPETNPLPAQFLLPAPFGTQNRVHRTLVLSCRGFSISGLAEKNPTGQAKSCNLFFTEDVRLSRYASTKQKGDSRLCSACFLCRPDAAEVLMPHSYNLTQRDSGLEALHCQDFDAASTYCFFLYTSLDSDSGLHSYSFPPLNQQIGRAGLMLLPAWFLSGHCQNWYVGRSRAMPYRFHRLPTTNWPSIRPRKNGRERWKPPRPL